MEKRWEGHGKDVSEDYYTCSSFIDKVSYICVFFCFFCLFFNVSVDPSMWQI